MIDTSTKPLGDAVVIEEPADELDEKRYYLSQLHFYETDLAKRLLTLGRSRPPQRQYLREDALQAAFEKQVGFRLTEQQVAACYSVLQSGVSVLTGGPGTGKTSIVRAIVGLGKAEQLRIGLASPTGRAARRLAEVTGEETKTVHRLLGWDHLEGGFIAGPDNPLPYDLLVIDEASMVDLMLGRSLLAAIDPRYTQLLLVGDHQQLPSVGAGRFLQDVMESGTATVCELTQIMRQAEKSGIIQDAHAIKRGDTPVLSWDDCTLIDLSDPEMIQQAIVNLACTAANTGVELQVLAPMHKGVIGVKELNRKIQAAVNPPHPGLPQLVFGKDERERIYRKGDRVINLVNDYERGVMNGDIGLLTAVDVKERLVEVTYPDTVGVYGGKDLDDVQLAYAISIHRAQGSEYEQVVIALHSGQHYPMLVRNLIYTGLTRAKSKVTIVGDMKAVSMAVANNKPARRYSGLLERLLA